MTEIAASEGRSYVIFRLGAEEYGLPIEHVSSIIRYELPTPVPRAPVAVLGVINLRGRVIPVMDLSARFGKGAFEPSAMARIVVAEGASGSVGIAVDSANEVTSLPLDEVQPVPDSILSPSTARAFSGVIERAGKLVILLDLDETIPHSEYAEYEDEGFNEGDSDV